MSPTNNYRAILHNALMTHFNLMKTFSKNSIDKELEVITSKSYKDSIESEENVNGFLVTTYSEGSNIDYDKLLNIVKEFSDRVNFYECLYHKKELGNILLVANNFCLILIELKNICPIDSAFTTASDWIRVNCLPVDMDLIKPIGPFGQNKILNQLKYN